VAWPTEFKASGRVLDGPIAGVKVCLDLNSNLVCDGPTTEPEAFTDAEGNYSLEYTGGRDPEALHVIAEVPADAIDVETGEAFGRPFTLMAPTSYPEVVSPLSTLVSSEQMTGKETGLSLTAAEAEARVRQSLDLPDSMKLISVDYIKASQADAHNVAKVLTQALKEFQSTLIEAPGFATAHQRAGRSARAEAIKVAAAESKSFLYDAILADSTILAGLPLEKAQIREFSESAKASFAGKIEFFVARAKLPADSVNETLVKLLDNGIYRLEYSNDFAVWCEEISPNSQWRRNKACSRREEVRLGTKTIVAQLVKRSGVERGTRSSVGKELLFPDKWGVWEYPFEKPCSSPHCRYQAKRDHNFHYVLDMEGNAGWILEKDADERAWEYQVEGNDLCSRVVRSHKEERVCVKLRDLSSLSLRELGYCSTPDKPSYFPTCVDANAVFPQRSVGVDIYVERLREDYEVFDVDRPMWPIRIFEELQFVRDGDLIQLQITEAESEESRSLYFAEWRGPYISVFFENHPGLNGRYPIERRSDDKRSVWIRARAPVDGVQGKASVLNGGWLSYQPDENQTIDHLLAHFTANSPAGYFQMEDYDCRVVGRISRNNGGWAVSWFKGNQASGPHCAPDLSPNARRYEQTFPIERLKVRGQDILRFQTSDIHKIEESNVFDFYIFFAVVKNKAGSPGIYNGKIQPGGNGIVEIMQSGNREISGSKELVDAVNASWGGPMIPWEEMFPPANPRQ